MTLPEIKYLLDINHTEEAYNECLKLWQSNLEDCDIRMIMTRCLKPMAEKFAAAQQADKLIETLTQLAQLRLEEIGEVSTANYFTWPIHILIKELRFKPQSCVTIADQLLNILPKLHFIKPHRYYSMLADTFLKVKRPQNATWQRFVEFMDWFGFENFMPQDYERIPLKNGKSIPSIVERVHITYYKALMAEPEVGKKHSEKIQSFIERLTKLHKIHPEYQYTLYHKALLLLYLGDKEKALEAIRPFVKKKLNDFWVWDVLSETIDDAETKLSCCCKALTCKTDEKFLGRVHLKTAQLMHELGYDNNARAEIRAMYAVYEVNKWRMPNEAFEMKRQDWYQQAEAPKSNLAFYQEHIKQSEELLFLDNPEIPILITHVNNTKHVCNFVTENKECGFFSTKGLKVRFTENTIYKVRISNTEIKNNKATLVMTCKPIKNIKPYTGTFLKIDEGQLVIKDYQSFGFVNHDIYVDLKRLDIDASKWNYSQVIVTAVISYNSKKDKWNWRAISLKKKQD